MRKELDLNLLTYTLVSAMAEKIDLQIRVMSLMANQGKTYTERFNTLEKIIQLKMEAVK